METAREAYVLDGLVSDKEEIWYLIGGSTRRPPNKTMKWNHYKLHDRGIRK